MDHDIAEINRVAQVKIEGLFGYLDHVVELRAGEPTIITAPNGAGKTHVLNLTRAVLTFEARDLLSLPYNVVELQLVSRHRLRVERRVDLDGELSFTYFLFGPKGEEQALLHVTEDDLDDLRPKLPAHLRITATGRLYDRRTERFVSLETARRVYGWKSESPNRDLLADNAELRSLLESFSAITIDTQRLDVTNTYSRQEPPTSEADIGSASSSIARYINEISSQVTEARRGSVRATQSADLSFAARALAAARKTVHEAPLHARYDRIADQYENLANNGLAVGEAPLDFPDETTPTVRRILEVFLDDWEKRLEPLVPLNEKLNALRDILDTKLRQSGKATAISSRGLLIFRTLAGSRIRVSSLSSGEQHLVALFTLLLFSAKKGSIVLIDEPEISMHAAWKHAFLDDISRVASIAKLQIVIATHSTSIVNGRWDLEESLDLTPPPSPVITADDEDEMAEEE